MKKFWNVVFRIKLQACIVFTACAFSSLFVSRFIPEWSVSEAMLWQFLLIALVGSVLQWLAYSGDVIRRLRYAFRHMIFGVLYLAFLTPCAYCFGWFPGGSLGSWLAFVGIFIGIFVIIGAVFAVYYRITGKKYDEALDLFKQKKD